MEGKLINSIRWDGSDVEISVSVYLFKDGGTYVAYCPSLDLSGYDHTEELARKDFEYVLHDWMREQLKADTLRQDLIAHGWKIEGSHGEEPSLRQMLDEGSPACELAVLPEYRKMNVGVEMSLA